MRSSPLSAAEVVFVVVVEVEEEEEASSVGEDGVSLLVVAPSPSPGSAAATTDSRGARRAFLSSSVAEGAPRRGAGALAAARE